MAVNRLGRLGRLSGIWLDMVTRSQKPRHVGPPQNNQNESLARGVLQLLHHFAQYGWRWEGVCFQILPWPTEHPLLWPEDPVPVTQTEATCCWTSWQLSLFWAGATCCILSRRPLEGETTLFGWSGLAWIACPLPRSAGLECVGLRVTCFLVHQVKSPHSGAQVGPTSCLLPCLGMTLLCCCRLLQVLSCLSKGLGTLLKPERLL